MLFHRRPLFCGTVWTVWLRAAIGAGVVSIGGPVAATERAFSPQDEQLVRGFFTANCLACHAGGDTDSGVRLDDLPIEMTSVETAERWQKVLNVVNSGEMPPADRPRPEATAKTEALAAISQAMVVARKTLGDQGRTAVVRRLSRREYRNTLCDLLGFDLDAAGIDTTGLPDDRGTGEFDTIGSGLFMSSDQFEQYLAIGRRAAAAALTLWRQAAFTPAQRRSQRIECEGAARRQVANLLNGYFLTGYRKAKEWEAAGADPAKAGEYGFADADEARFRMQAYEREGSYLGQYLALPHGDGGAWLMAPLANLHHTQTVTVPKEAPPGRYLIRLAVAHAQQAPANRKFLEFGIQEQVNDNFALLDVVPVNALPAAPQHMEFPVVITAAGPRRFAIREKRGDPAAESFAFNRARLANGVGPDPALWVDWIGWDGPLEDAGDRERAHAVLPSEATAAGDAIARFARKAFRGVEPDADFIERLVALYRERLEAGGSPDTALAEAFAVILASPGFLYLDDPVEAVAGGITDVELAARLSYFLVAGPPDEPLLTAAAAGTLRTPAGLAAEVDRLLATPRSRRFVEGFAHQWLGLDRLDFFRFDPQLYPEFDDSTRAAARREVYETFNTLVHDNLDARLLVKSEFVVIDDLLAAFYGLDADAPAGGFRVVTLPPGSPRGGLLGMAAILAMGSDGERTSPVERGAWVLRKVMHAAPPPAPPNVPQLSRLGAQPVPVRERLRMHQEEPQCAQCHRVIDPIGLGLENFDAVGRWRTDERHYSQGWVVENRLAGKVVRQTWPIEAGGAFHHGPTFADFFELRDLLRERHGDAFVRGLIENLFAYALGRPVSFADAATIDSLTSQALRDGCRLRTIIQTLVATPEFQAK
jgi:hypothetical protein